MASAVGGESEVVLCNNLVLVFISAQSQQLVCGVDLLAEVLPPSRLQGTLLVSIQTCPHIHMVSQPREYRVIRILIPAIHDELRLILRVICPSRLNVGISSVAKRLKTIINKRFGSSIPSYVIKVLTNQIIRLPNVIAGSMQRHGLCVQSSPSLAQTREQRWMVIH